MVVCHSRLVLYSEIMVVCHTTLALYSKTLVVCHTRNININRWKIQNNEIS
jgi:hypothetical protein